ncbi:toll/interleukin-1 receptor domain-containing protein [Rhodococcus sp. WS4]|nr:toll/interleukin-1 receptor domain-containing protein [Rhodococcus sp. WS4]
MTSAEGKHVFVSYVKEDAEQVDQLCKMLDAARIPYWRDRTSLAPGDAWKTKIRKAIRSGALVFLACFSEQSRARDSNYMNEELTLAVDEYRKLAPGKTWLIPIRFDDGEVPEWELGAGRLISDLNYVDLFGDNHIPQAASLIATISSLMGDHGPDPTTVRVAVAEAAADDRPLLLRRLTKEMVLDPARRIEMDDLISQETNRVLAAMHDNDRFPTHLPGGTDTERIVKLVEIAQDYWQLAEPLCWSLQVAARWAEPTALAPWANALRLITTEANAHKGDPLLDLRFIPSLAATFVAALASAGQRRWDNLKALTVDTEVLDPQLNRAMPLVDVVDPWRPFGNAQDIAHTLARSAKHQEDPQTARGAFTTGRATKYYTPVADWLHIVLRPAFSEQFPDNTIYDTEFDHAEVWLGLVAQDCANVRAGAAPERAWLRRTNWYGRSTWRNRYNHDSTLVGEIAQRKLTEGTEWGPQKAGLFGGESERADKAITEYAETFDQLRQQRS